MGPEVAPVQTDESLPSEAEVVIIGGGIIGASTALFLSLRGIRCVLLEKGAIAGEQSSRNWGWVRKMGRDPREIPLMLQSQRIWSNLNALTQRDTGYVQSGIAYLCASEQALAQRQSWLDSVRDFDLDTKLLTGAPLRSVFPNLPEHSLSALYTASDGRAEPQQAVPAIIEGARANGAKVYAHCAARTIEKAGGRVAAVTTEQGEIKCDAVVIAGGAWTSLFCANMGVRVPQLKVQGSVARTAPLPGGPTAAMLGGDFSFRKRSDGGYTITRGLSVRAEIVPDSFRYFYDFLPLLQAEWRSLDLAVGQRSLDELRLPRHWSADEKSPFESARMLDPHPIDAIDAMVSSDLVKLFPCFGNARVVQVWAGLIDVTPDVIPIISSVEGWPGAVVASGFSGHGFGIGPGAGQLVCDLVTGQTPVVDPGPFRLQRFADGSRPRPLTGI